MWRMLVIALLLAGCEQLPPSPADIQAKRFESVPDKSVIYIVRTPMDSQESSGLSLDDLGPVTMLPGTYYRWEVAPGKHRVAGYGMAQESVTLATAPGKIYFLQHSVFGRPRTGPVMTRLQQISEQDGRAMVTRAEMLR